MDLGQMTVRECRYYLITAIFKLPFQGPGDAIREDSSSIGPVFSGDA
jgi:hypothetical protein